MTRPNQARKGASTKLGKRFVRTTSKLQGQAWHLSPELIAYLYDDGYLILRREGDAYGLSNHELRALYTRLWYLEKCGKIRRIKP